jgi:hypothetical protein
MKKYYFIFLSVVLLLTCSSLNAFALRYGPYYATFHSKISVQGYGSESDVTYGTCNFKQDYTFELYDQGIDVEYDGTFSIVNKNKQIIFYPNTDAFVSLEDVIISWIENTADYYGISVQNLQVLNYKYSISKASISKKTGLPGSTTVKLSGKVHAIVNGKAKTKTFSYQSKITLSPS